MSKFGYSYPPGAENDPYAPYNQDDEYGGEENWTQFCKRTNDPKLAWIEGELTRRGIASQRNGESFHAPILDVPEDDLEAALDLLDEDVFSDGRRFDDIEDDDPIFT